MCQFCGYTGEEHGTGSGQSQRFATFLTYLRFDTNINTLAESQEDRLICSYEVGIAKA